ncbi:hypothetical protein G6F37_003538 [Rhizopus arrhizus]|nr:hypothetical protein G6F38_008543 [Rhizopus arrhizus]KAG1160925.1 hypothetical protein G6F37_003538 [Rhizopus arrhizus]
MDKKYNMIEKRNSFSAYIPMHRRTEEHEIFARRGSMNKYRSGEFEGKRSSRRFSTNRLSRSSFDELDYKDNNSDAECPQEDWENVLRQYDRYGSFDDDRRRSRRASRLLEPYIDNVTVQVPPPEEPTTILDCYDFPSSFQTHHLHDIFRAYETMRGGYKIKWLSDTRALIIFEHPATAKKAYIDNVTNASAKIRPYDGPTDFLRRNSKIAQ